MIKGLNLKKILTVAIITMAVLYAVSRIPALKNFLKE